ncbi:site-specific DNA-methyltransferase [Clostridium sp. KNHs216]|uniref:DNA-methyltransferase n=1 Tax=Clostridium sp. KNHs216 TaxID=1550235 RepID=UPI0011509283|nr:site-specific DNA-methyltransferase [Clostridium sp. KNHs216]TQI67892.1 site-specific DNA-methyltransferase (adenine-specific) [Clostridium sp. KNHs216]
MSLFDEKPYCIRCINGSEGLLALPKKSVKLVYGSPPYPNADRNYGVWKSDKYIDKLAPFIDASIAALREDGFLVINVKANREKHTSKSSPRRSLVIERLAILLEDQWNLHCVDIEVWVKGNPVPTGLRCACQDAYEQILWFSISPKWNINLDAIRRPYSSHSLEVYKDYEYKPRENGLSYVRKKKTIQPNTAGALPNNVILSGVSNAKGVHQAVQPSALPEKYIKATTSEGDLVVDPWLGSGTTGVMAIELGRRFAGFDIFQEYIDLSEAKMDEAWQGRRRDNGTVITENTP